MKLNPEQIKAVSHFNGPCIVTATPGSGKTLVLTTRVIYLISKKGTDPRNILCTTFTNKAADEMKDRIIRQVGDQGKLVFVNTFHGICLAILKKYGNRIGLPKEFSVYSEKDQIELTAKICRMQDYEYNDYYIKRIMKAVNDYREDTHPDSFQDHVKNLPLIEIDIVQDYLKFLDEFHAVDFSGILFKCWQLLEDKEVVKILSDRFKYILVDESQDMNSIQYDICKRIGTHKNLFWVADFNQCVKEGQDVWISFRNGRYQTKRIEQIKKGDKVLSACGENKIKLSEVLYRQKVDKNTIEIRIKTASGKKIECTFNHHFFVKRGICWEAPDKNFVYLMRKNEKFRIGTSQFYGNKERSPGMRNGFAFRCQCEQADVGWVISYHNSLKQARTEEKILSYKYDIPTEVFICRNSKGMFTQIDLDQIHDQINSKCGALKLLSDKHIDFNAPHWIRDCTRTSKRSTFSIFLLADRGAHRYAIRSSHQEFIDEIEKCGYEMFHGSSDVKYTKRYEGSNQSLKKILDFKEKICDIADKINHIVLFRNKCKPVRGDSLLIVPASSLMIGDFIPVLDNNGFVMLDQIKSINSYQNSGTYYDLEIADTHNFVTNGIVHSNSIYGWRGARPEILKQIKKEFPEVNEITLPRNYRSTSEILEAAERLINNNDDTDPVQLISEKGHGNEISIQNPLTPEEEAQNIAFRIKVLKSKHPEYSWKDFAILYRTNFLSKTIEIELRNANIPYHIVGGFSFFDRKEIKNALAYLSFVVNPFDTISFARAVSEPKRAIGTQAIGKIEKLCRDEKISILDIKDKIDDLNFTKKTRENLKSFIDMMQRFHNLHKTCPVSQLVINLFDESGYIKHIKSISEGDQLSSQRIDNLNELINSIAQFEQSKKNNRLSDYLNNIKLLTSSDLEDDQDAVSLLTMHASKGLEFNVVFVTGCDQNIIPHPLALKERGPQEERRLMYVSMTRAASYLFISYPQRRQKFLPNGRLIYINCQPSPFLFELYPSSLTEKTE